MKIYFYFFFTLSFLTSYVFFYFLNKFYLQNKNLKNKKNEKKYENKYKILDYFSEIIVKKVNRNYEFYKNLPPEKYEEELKIWYKNVIGIELDLNNPKTFNEKIQWLKLYDSTPKKTLLADKYLVKNFIKDTIGKKYVIPLLKVWDSYNEINFDSLPNKFILKANHGSGMNIIINDKSKYNLESIKKIAKKWMNINYAFSNGLELHYMNIKPKIIAEMFYDNKNGDLFDYKIYCFNGRVESIAFLSAKKKFRRIAFYDTNWNRLNYTDTYPPFEYEIPKPKKLKEMVEISQKLSKGFAFVRVDLYVLNNENIKFGEMTFTPDSGKLNFNPVEQNRIFGDMIKLPKKSPIPKKIIE